MKKNILFFVTIGLVIFIGVSYFPTAISHIINYVNTNDMFVDRNVTLRYAILYSLVVILSISLGTTCLIMGIRNIKKNDDLSLVPFLILLSTTLVVTILAAVVDGMYAVGNIEIYRNDITYEPTLASYYEGKITSCILGYIISTLKNIGTVIVSILSLIFYKKATNA